MPRVPNSYERLLGTLDILKPEEPANAEFPDDPVQFIHDVLGIKLWSMQEEIVYSVWENRYTSVASCHAVGKSTVSAAIVITYLHLHENSIVISTAPTGRQVENILWRNIRNMYKKAKRPLLGRPPLTLRYEIAETWYGMGFKPTDQETDPLQGFHAIHILSLIDEAAGVAPTLIDGMMAAMTTEEARMLMIGNPTSTSGPFFDSHHDQEHMYKTFNIAWEDTPNFKAGRTVYPGLITQQWVDDVAAKYGKESAYYRSRVNADWVSAEDVLIPLHLIEEALARAPFGTESSDVKQAGLDVARDGKDKSVLTMREGSKVLGSWEVEGTNSFVTVENARKLLDMHMPDVKQVKVDEIGLGVGVLDVWQRDVQKENLPYQVIGVNFSKKPHDPEKYMNQRCEAYGLMADRFRGGDIYGHIHDGVKSDLSDLRFKFNGRHTQPVIEPKDDFRKRVGHSPDYGDSFVLAFYNPPPDEVEEIGVLAFGYATQKWGKL